MSAFGFAKLTNIGLMSLGGTLKFLLGGQSDRARSVRNALFAFAIRCASALTLYVAQVLLARWTGSHDYGVYVYAWTLVMLLGAFSCAGLNVVTMRLLPEYREKRELALARGLIAGSRRFAIIFGIFISLIAIAMVLVAGSRIAPYYVYPLLIAFLAVPAYALTDLHDGIGRAQTWMATALGPPYVLRPVMLVVTVYTALAYGLEPKAVTLASCAVLAVVSTMAIQSVLLERRLKASIAPGPVTFDYQSWLRISLPLVVIGVCDMLLNHTDIIVVALYMTPSDAGIYFAAAKTMSLMMYVHYSVGSAVANRISALNASGNVEALKECIRDSVSWTFWPSLFAGIVILTVGKSLLQLFGPQFVDGYSMMLILMTGFLVRSLFGPIEFVLSMLGAHRACAIVLVSATLMNIVLNLWFVPIWGTTGAAAATASSLAAASIANYFIVRTRLGINCVIWARNF